MDVSGVRRRCSPMLSVSRPLQLLKRHACMVTTTEASFPSRRVGSASR